jgi:Tat protein secretion system quality control protein TatD with DNase activity
MGKIAETLAKVQKQNQSNHHKLPPRIYFHAFGGKAATVTQLIKSLEKSTKKKSNTKVYFGFAPILNFASPKTIEVLRTVGLERLVLETEIKVNLAHERELAEVATNPEPSSDESDQDG